MKVLGIDPSLNSTGICLIDTEKKLPKYWIVTNDNKYKSAKMIEYITKEFRHKRLDICFWQHTDTTSKKYSDIEQTKTHNILNLKNIIASIIKKVKPDYVYMEGVSYASAGRVADLAGLNYLIRDICRDCQLHIISPNENKKIATGNGSADKEEMIFAWQKCDNLYKDIDKRIKTDDLADAYFLANIYNYEFQTIKV